jgi:hypothetical protein
MHSAPNCVPPHSPTDQASWTIYADVGRPRSKGKDVIRISDKTSVLPIVAFLRRALRIRIEVPHFSYGEHGITDMSKNIDILLAGLKARTVGAIYLPNLRWFPGEEVTQPVTG